MALLNDALESSLCLGLQVLDHHWPPEKHQVNFPRFSIVLTAATESEGGAREHRQAAQDNGRCHGQLL